MYIFNKAPHVASLRLLNLLVLYIILNLKHKTCPESKNTGFFKELY